MLGNILTIIQLKHYVKVAVRITSNGILFARTLYTLNESKFLRKLNNNHYEKILDMKVKK